MSFQFGMLAAFLCQLGLAWYWCDEWSMYRWYKSYRPPPAFLIFPVPVDNSFSVLIGGLLYVAALVTAVAFLNGCRRTPTFAIGVVLLLGGLGVMIRAFLLG